MAREPLVPLPADEAIPALLSALDAGRNAVVVAPPGAGKTTRLPPAISESGLLKDPNRAVAVLQPRRVAARSVAARIASERGWRLGEEVGYQVRFDNRTTARTRIRVMTEGILARRLQSDPFLEGIGCVVLDEFHERSIHTDLALAMLREVQTAVRSDLRIVVMSATMDAQPVAAFLGEAPVVACGGEPHPVELFHADRPASDVPCWERAAHAARLALARPQPETGHVLVFLPGMGEIRRTAELLHDVDAETHVLHGSVPAAEQDRALAPSARRKLILATNIAETSITINGVCTVIDSGLARVPVNDPRLGIDRLELQRISLASARQRTGRAGRTAPGKCYRLWTREEEASLRPHDMPEVHRIDLAATVLALKAYGAGDVASFGWFDPPRADALERALALLRLLSALDGDGRLTEKGEALSRLPLHPRLGALLLAGKREGVLREAALMAALLSERDPFPPGRRRGAGAAWSGTSDVLDRLDVIAGEGPLPPEADATAVEAIRRTARELERLAR